MVASAKLKFVEERLMAGRPFGVRIHINHVMYCFALAFLPIHALARLVSFTGRHLLLAGCSRGSTRSVPPPLNLSIALPWGTLYFSPMAQCAVHALKGLACRVCLRLARLPRTASTAQCTHAFAPRARLRHSFSRTLRSQKHAICFNWSKT